jgi:hypothetical protein
MAGASAGGGRRPALLPDCSLRPGIRGTVARCGRHADKATTLGIIPQAASSLLSAGFLATFSRTPVVSTIEAGTPVRLAQNMAVDPLMNDFVRLLIDIVGVSSEQAQSAELQERCLSFVLMKNRLLEESYGVPSWPEESIRSQVGAYFHELRSKKRLVLN